MKTNVLLRGAVAIGVFSEQRLEFDPWLIAPGVAAELSAAAVFPESGPRIGAG